MDCTRGIYLRVCGAFGGLFAGSLQPRRRARRRARVLQWLHGRTPADRVWPGRGRARRSRRQVSPMNLDIEP